MLEHHVHVEYTSTVRSSAVPKYAPSLLRNIQISWFLVTLLVHDGSILTFLHHCGQIMRILK